MLTCWVGGVALKPNMCGGRTLWWLRMWWWNVVAASKAQKGREACLAIESLQAGGEYGSGWRVSVPAVHVGLHRVNAGAASTLATRCVARTVVPLLPRLLTLLQRLAQQALVVPVLQALVLVLMLKLRAGWPKPRLPFSLAVVPGSLCGGLLATRKRRRVGSGGVAGTLQQRAVVCRVLLLGQGEE